jgi:hypothetical protein
MKPADAVAVIMADNSGLAPVASRIARDVFSSVLEVA